MSKKVFNMQGGMHSAAAFSAFENRRFGSVKATPDSFVVSAGSGMNASISTGDGLISVDNDSAKRIQSTATETALVPPASASFNRIDSVVAYIDTAVTVDPDFVDNTNDVLKFVVVAGTAASTPVAPTSGAILSAIGAGKPYLILCNITVPQNAVNLSAATFDNIAPTPLLKNYPIGAVFISVNSTNPQTLFGGKWSAFAAGRTLVGLNSGDTDFDTVEETGGAKTHSHTLGAGFAYLSNPGNTFQIRRKSGPSWSATHALTGSSAGGGGPYSTVTELGGDTDAGSTLQPYIVTYMWKRTA